MSHHSLVPRSGFRVDSTGANAGEGKAGQNSSSEIDVLTRCLFPPPPRDKFYKSKGATPDLIECWEEMIITDIVGFPVWEQEVFALIQPNFLEITAIFQQSRNCLCSCGGPIGAADS